MNTDSIEIFSECQEDDRFFRRANFSTKCTHDHIFREVQNY